MPLTYHITGTRSSGQRATVEVTADSPGQAEARANAMGLTVTSLRETSADGILPPAPWSPARAIRFLVLAAVLIVVAALIAGPALAAVGEQRRTYAKLQQTYDDPTGGYNFSTSTVYSPTPTSDGWAMVPHTVTGGGGSAFRGRDKLKADLAAAATQLNLTYARLGAAALLALLGAALGVTAVRRRDRSGDGPRGFEINSTNQPDAFRAESSRPAPHQ